MLDVGIESLDCMPSIWGGRLSRRVAESTAVVIGRWSPAQGQPNGFVRVKECMDAGERMPLREQLANCSSGSANEYVKHTSELCYGHWVVRNSHDTSFVKCVVQMLLGQLSRSSPGIQFRARSDYSRICTMQPRAKPRLLSVLLFQRAKVHFDPKSSSNRLVNLEDSNGTEYVCRSRNEDRSRRKGKQWKSKQKPTDKKNGKTKGVTAPQRDKERR